VHVVGTRVAHDYYGVQAGYPWVLASLAAGGWCGIARQFSLPSWSGSTPASACTSPGA
jgi:adenylate cyclase